MTERQFLNSVANRISNVWSTIQEAERNDKDEYTKKAQRTYFTKLVKRKTENHGNFD